jgi:plasmid maintenance system antidote protein VapI
MKEGGCTHADAIKLLAELPTTFDEWKKLQNASNQREMATDAAGADRRRVFRAAVERVRRILASK